MGVNTAIILAGGLGTRLRSVVSDVPKPMAPIGDKPFLAFLLEYWYQQGIRHYVLSVGYKHEIIMQYFGERFHDALITYAIEEEPMGTGGGLLLALSKLGNEEHVLVLNGDTYFEIDLMSLEKFAETEASDMLFSAFQSQNGQRYLPLPVVNETGKIDFLANAKVIQSEFWVNGGVYLLRPEIFTNFGLKKCSLEQDLFHDMAKRQGRIYAKKFEAKFIDIGIPEDYFLFKTRMELSGHVSKMEIL